MVGMPSKDTVKIADENGMVEETPKRSRVWSIQTPQAFSYDLIKKAHECARAHCMDEITDDAMVIEAYTQVPVRLVKGSYENIKITTPDDLLVAEKNLEKIYKRY